MLSTNRIIICAAGGGKTTSIVNEACQESGSRCALITYTKTDEGQRLTRDKTDEGQTERYLASTMILS